MAKNRTIQVYRGTTAQNDAYTGSAGEITMDTTTNTIRIHDGVTLGGHEIGGGGGGTGDYHPDLFDVKWADHELNDMAWLRADTFSWQPGGSTYSNAYNHLVDDANIHIWGLVYATKKRHPSAGDTVWHGSISTGTVISYDSSNDAITISVDGTTSTLGYIQAEPYTSLPVIIETETIAGTTVQFYTANDGHKICTADQESNVTAIYNATGVAWYYIIDTTNQRFKLPRTKFGFTGLRDRVGKYVEAGLPSFSATFNVCDTNGSVAASGDITLTDYQNGAYGGGNGRTNSEATATLKPSNSIYGNSTTVQSPATQMYLYFYVGEFSQTAIENTAGLNAELFNNKADKTFTNTDMIDYVVEKQEPSAENDYTWYRKYKSGWVEQGGKLAAASSAVYVITLPVPMADTSYTALGTLISNNISGSGGSFATVYILSSTQINLGLDYASTWTGTGCFWVAYGKAA